MPSKDGCNMNTTDWQHLTAQLRRQEDERLKPYRDPFGYLTIGVGRNLDVKGIRADESSLMLSNDMLEALQGVTATLSWFPSLDPVRQAVLVNMAFNLGVDGLLDFHRMLAAVEHGQYGQASDEMMDSVWAKQVKGRAAELAAQMKTGRWQQ